MCYTAPLVGVALGIGVKVPNGSTNGLNSMVSTTIKRGRDTLTGTARNYGNITRRNSGNCGTSNGTSGAVISTLERVQPMDPRVMATTDSARCEELGPENAGPARWYRC